MKEITSVKTGVAQVVDEKTWENIVERGWQKKYTVIEMPEKTLKEVPKIIPAEIKTKTKKNEQNN